MKGRFKMGEAKKMIQEQPKFEEEWQNIVWNLFHENPSLGKRRIQAALQDEYNIVITEYKVQQFMKKQGLKGKPGRQGFNPNLDYDYIEQIIGEEQETAPFIKNPNFTIEHTVNLGFLYPYEPNKGETPLRYRMDLVFIVQEFSKDYQHDRKIALQAYNKEGELEILLLGREIESKDVRNGVTLLVLSPCLQNIMQSSDDTYPVKWTDPVDNNTKTAPVAYPNLPYKSTQDFWHPMQNIDFPKLLEEFNTVNQPFDPHKDSHPLHPVNLRKTLEEYPELLFMIRDKVIDLKEKINDIERLEDIDYNWELNIEKIYQEILIDRSRKDTVSILGEWCQYYKEYLDFRRKKQGPNSNIENSTYRDNIPYKKPISKDIKPGEPYRKAISGFKKRGIYTKAILLNSYFPHRNAQQRFFKICSSLLDRKLQDYIHISQEIRKQVHPKYGDDIQNIFEPSPGFIMKKDRTNWGLAKVTFKLTSNDAAFVLFARGFSIHKSHNDEQIVHIYCQTPLWDEVESSVRNTLILEKIQESVDIEIWSRITFVENSIQYTSLTKGIELFESVDFATIQKEFQERNRQ